MNIKTFLFEHIIRGRYEISDIIQTDHSCGDDCPHSPRCPWSVCCAPSGITVGTPSVSTLPSNCMTLYSQPVVMVIANKAQISPSHASA